MNRTQAAGYGLLASAFILGALVVVQSARYTDHTAQAEMVVNKDFITLVTAQQQGDSETLYMLDAKSEILLSYQVNPSRETIELLPGGVLNIGQAFDTYLGRNRGGQQGNQGGNRGR